MPKKQIHNAFYYFMLDYQERAKYRGKIYNGLREVQADPECTQEWTAMSAQEKSKYTNLAKDMKMQARTGKLTGTGESVELLALEEQRKRKFVEYMNQHLDSIISSAIEKKSLPNCTFYFIHVNYFYKREVGLNETDYIPAEFAVVKFSLNSGTEDIYHRTLYCKPALGYAREALEHSKNTHQIDFRNSGECDFNKIYNELMVFLKRAKHSNVVTPVFTMSNVRNVVKSFFDKLSDASGEDLESVPIYSLETLFSKLLNSCYKGTFSPTLAEYELVKDTFSFTVGIECDYHSRINESSQFCSMSIVKRWVYIICDNCCEPLNITRKPYVHYPVEKTENTDLMLTKSFSVMTIDSQSERTKSVTGQSLTDASSIRKATASERTVTEEKRRNDEKPVSVVDYTSRSEISDVASEIESTFAKNFEKTYANVGSKETFDLTSDVDGFPPIGGNGTVTRKKRTIAALARLSNIKM